MGKIGNAVLNWTRLGTLYSNMSELLIQDNKQHKEPLSPCISFSYLCLNYALINYGNAKYCNFEIKCVLQEMNLSF